MQTGYTQLDAEEREAVRTNGAITGQLLTAAARLTRQALDRGLHWLQNRTRPPTDLELTSSQQQAADIIAVTTERCGELQGDGSLAFETEQYRFSVTPDGIYSAVDKELNWTVFEFQRDRQAVQEKAAALVDLATDYGDYTPEAAVAATSGAVDELFTGIRSPDVSLETSAPASSVAATLTDEPVELDDSADERAPVPGADQTGQAFGDNHGDQTIAAMLANLVEAQGELIEPIEETLVDGATTDVITPDESVFIPDDPWVDSVYVNPTAAISDELVAAYGELVQPIPPKRYVGEGFDIYQQGNHYEVRDSDNQPLFSFEKQGNQYHILQDHLSDEQRQQFARVHTRTQAIELNTVMADPTGNTQLHYLEDLAPEGSKAVAVAHHHLDLANTDQLETQSQSIIRHEDRSLMIYAKSDNRVIVSATASGKISSQMTSQEKAEFAHIWQHTSQQSIQSMPQPSRSTDLER